MTIAKIQHTIHAHGGHTEQSCLRCNQRFSLVATMPVSRSLALLGPELVRKAG